MTIDQYNKAGPIVQKINEANAELSKVDEIVADLVGTAKVKIDQRWIINIPASDVKGYAQTRKAELDQQITDLEAELAKI